MKSWAIVGILVLCIGIGCAGLKVNAEGITLESLVEKSKSLEPDGDGWRVLGVPDKDFYNNYIEFIFFTKELDWGAGFMQHGVVGSDVFLIYKEDTKQWYMVMYGQVVQCTPEEAKSGLIDLWGIVKENGDFNKIRPFVRLNPTPKESI